MNRRRPRRRLQWLAPREPPLPAVSEPGCAPTHAEALLAALGTGDVSAFAELYDHTRARLYGVALRVLREPASATEATQEAYAQIWATAGSFDPAECSAEAWLTTLIHRVSVERVRAEPCRAARILGCSNGNRVGGCQYVLDEVRHHMVSAESDALNDWQRETIALAYYGAMTRQQVAEFLDVPLSTVTSRIRTGLTRLAQSSD